MLAPRGAARYDGTQIQLIAPLGADSPLSRFLTRSGPAMHHLAYRVGSIDLATQLLTDRGVRLLYDAARSGTRGSRINFVHPRDAGGVLVELFDETASAAGSFPFALRGYERSAVDEYVRALESTLVAARRQAQRFQEQLDEAKTKELNYTNLGGRATDIMRLAEEQAREVLDQAATEAERIKEAARRDAENIRLTAAREGNELKTAGLADLKNLRARGEQEVRDQLKKSAGEAAAITRRAQQEVASRMQQLRRETELLSQRKQAVLNQLASLSALAEQTAQSFPELEDLESFDPQTAPRTITDTQEGGRQEQQSPERRNGEVSLSGEISANGDASSRGEGSHELETQVLDTREMDSEGRDAPTLDPPGLDDTVQVPSQQPPRG
jgi:HPt (histidine-containing phosphotransfer) domain-containing protein